MKRNICVVTGTRAEYGLLSLLMHKIAAAPEFNLQIVATGTHLEPAFGSTYRQIEADGFTIDRQVYIQLTSDTAAGVANSTGMALAGIAAAYAELKPDVVLLLGDRYEIFAAAAAASLSRIPIAHIHGGETTEGAVDEAFRHAISKMSYWHFTATEAYRKRVIQLGEHPGRVYNVGGMGVDVIKNTALLSRVELEVSFAFALDDFAIVTFHPETLGNVAAGEQFSRLLEALDAFPELKLVFSYANADADGAVINRMIDEYSQRDPARSIAFKSMGQRRYLSALSLARVVIGNSSSGLLEAPTFKVPTVNIGDRQRGRIKADSVIDCKAETDAITTALRQALSADFKRVLATTENPYGSGGASDKIVDIIKSCSGGELKKTFFDIDFSI